MEEGMPETKRSQQTSGRWKVNGRFLQIVKK